MAAARAIRRHEAGQVGRERTGRGWQLNMWSDFVRIPNESYYD
jgi:hypothetical protein